MIRANPPLRTFLAASHPLSMMNCVLVCLLAVWIGWSPAVHAAPSPDSAQRPGRVEVRGEWFYVDGEPFLIKGVGYSPYRPGQVPWRDRVDPALMERDFARIARAGFNTIRTWSPLSDEALALANRYGLMVLQGIWIERNGNYNSSTFRETMLEILRRETERAKTHDNILAIIVGNELLPEQVFKTGIPETESLLKRAAEMVKQTDPARLISYANWPSLAFLNTSPWDLVCFNLYPYEPASVSRTFGFRSYVEHLRRTASRGKPLVITEVGLSVSPVGGQRPGYGGNSAEAQRANLLALWDALFQAGAQGGAIFEWNDEWWKQADATGDETSHEGDDAEEWFGLIEFQGADDREGRPRPALEALKTYNQAIILSPVDGQSYQDRLQLTVYATEQVAAVQFRLGKPAWSAPWAWTHATRLSRHQWKATVPLPPKLRAGEHALTVEALDAKGRLLARHQRVVTVKRPSPEVRVRVHTDRDLYEVGREVETVRYTVTVTDHEGNPLSDRPVHLSVVEPQASVDLSQTTRTDAKGSVEGTYLVKEPGLVGISAATPVAAGAPDRRVGGEVFVVVRQQPQPMHQASLWEAGLPADVREALAHAQPAFRLADTGTEPVVDYARYGRFQKIGTAAYRYEVSDWEGLGDAVGEGIYPNEGGLLRDPAYREAVKGGLLSGSHWDFTFLKDVQLSFFKWASTDEEPGVKQFYTALTLERAGLWQQAVKAYDAVLVHFPTSIGWTAFDPPTPWYVGKVARDKIEAILRLHPELGLRLEGAQVIVQNGFDNDVENDTILVNPGRLVRVGPEQVNPPTADLTSLAVTRQMGRGRVRAVQYENGHWQLLVDGKPWTVHGLTYKPTAVGETPDEGPLPDWTITDRNANGVLDVLETFVDANRNNRQDPDEPTVEDFALIRQMGVNTLRVYHTDHRTDAAKALLRTLYTRYGFMVMMGDFVGMYTIGSGARWEEGTNYLDKTQRKRMVESVKAMVRAYKDEPYLLVWVLGNENNYGGVHGIIGGVGNAGKYPKEYYRFINELATWIHAEDPNHPVAIGNGDVLFLDVIAKEAPAIDIFGANAYRGWQGFGRSFFEEVRQQLDKPVLVTEYGCPAYQTGEPREVAERDQALYHLGNWLDIADNLAGRGVGSAIGGVAFEWVDEWWKAGQPPRFSPRLQETRPNWAGPYPGGWNFEEWLGLVSQGDGSHSPWVRQPRVSYQLYKALWNVERE